MPQERATRSTGMFWMCFASLATRRRTYETRCWYNLHHGARGSKRPSKHIRNKMNSPTSVVRNGAPGANLLGCTDPSMSTPMTHTIGESSYVHLQPADVRSSSGRRVPRHQKKTCDKVGAATSMCMTTWMGHGFPRDLRGLRRLPSPLQTLYKPCINQINHV